MPITSRETVHEGWAMPWPFRLFKAQFCNMLVRADKYCPKDANRLVPLPFIELGPKSYLETRSCLRLCWGTDATGGDGPGVTKEG